MFLQVPSGLLPAMELDGELYTESDVLMRVIEERFPERPLLPPTDSPAYSRAQQLFRLERQLFGAWLQWLCQSWSVPHQLQGYPRMQLPLFLPTSLPAYMELCCKYAKHTNPD